MDPRVLEAMLPYFTRVFGNAASRNHSFGWEAEAAVEQARGQVAGLFGASAKEIVFTSGATESNNLAIKGAAHFYKDRGRHIITSKIEPKAVIDSCRALEMEGFTVTYLSPDKDGLITRDAIAAALQPDTILVSIMAANNEIGTVNPVAEIGALCREKGVLWVKAVQPHMRVRLDHALAVLREADLYKAWYPCCAVSEVLADVSDLEVLFRFENHYHPLPWLTIRDDVLVHTYLVDCSREHGGLLACGASPEPADWPRTPLPPKLQGRYTGRTHLYALQFYCEPRTATGGGLAGGGGGEGDDCSLTLQIGIKDTGLPAWLLDFILGATLARLFADLAKAAHAIAARPQSNLHWRAMGARPKLYTQCLPELISACEAAQSGDRPGSGARTAVQPAGSACGAGRHKVRALDQTALPLGGAAWVEGAARRNFRETRHGAVDLRQPLGAHAEARDRTHEAFGIGMLGVLHDLAHRADLSDAAGIHHGDAVRGFGDHAHVVRHQHHRRAVFAAQPLQERDDLGLDRDVERGRRLVGHDQPRPGAESERDHDPLTHAAGELVRIVIDAHFGAGDTHLLQEFDRPRLGLAGRQRQMGLDRLDQLAAHRIERIEAGQRILKNRADLRAADLAHLLVGQVVDAPSLESNLAGSDAARRLQQPDDGVSGQRLAGAGLSHHAQDFARGDVEGDVVDGEQRAPARRKLDPQVADFEERLVVRCGGHLS
jgi:hypothetical protein